MSTGTWDPGSGQSSGVEQIDSAMLQRFVAIATSPGVEQLTDAISDADRSQAAIMQAGEAQWRAALQGFDDDALLQLVRFFTIAEMQLDGWTAGQNSPVIAINRILRERGVKLDKELLRWIRANSDNRYLPNGAVL